MASDLEMQEAEDAIDHHRDRIAELEAENERLRRLVMAQSRAIHSPEALSRTGAVKVKVLEWAFRETKPSPDLSVWLAGAPGLNETYSIWHSTDPNATAPYTVPSLHNGFFDTLDEAKAAAQADYERRILSAITTEPAAPEGRQEVVLAAVELGRKAINGATIATETQGLIRDPLQNYVRLEDAFLALQSARPSEQAVSMKWLADWQGRHDIVMPIAAYNELQFAITRPAVTDAAVEEVAKLITKWMGFSWDGLRDVRVTDEGFPVFMYHSQTGWQFQGGKSDMLGLARAALKAAMEAGHD